MEVAMTRTAIRHTLSAVAAVALDYAYASSPVSAQGDAIDHHYRGEGSKAKGLATKTSRRGSNQPGGIPEGTPLTYGTCEEG
jgi:hypothetical protein